MPVVPRFISVSGVWHPLSLLLLALAGVIRSDAALPVRLNEILANYDSIQNVDGSINNWIELYNPSLASVDLSNTSLTDDLTQPRRFVFPAGATIPAGGFRVVSCDPASPKSALNTGFGLKAAGGGVYFYDTPANGGRLIDSIGFGIQAANYSIGRVPDGSGSWVLTTPSRGAGNFATFLGQPTALKINEWDPNTDYFELYNGGALPVALGGLFVTDNLSNPRLYRIPDLTFIGIGRSGAYVLFHADGLTGLGPNHVGFRLNRDGESIGLSSGAGLLIDSVTFGNRRGNPGSEGRWPDGSDTIVWFTDSPSPGAYNRRLGLLSDIVVNELLTHTDPPLEDAIEFYNVTDGPINMKNWLLRLNPAAGVTFEPTKFYRITNTLMVPPRGYAVLYENRLGGMRFNSAHGGEIVLTQNDPLGNPVAFVTLDFGPAQNGIPFGRYQTSDGNYDFVALGTPSFGASNPRSVTDFRKGIGQPNAAPLVGPIVINEIMYYPLGTATNDYQLDEFIELRNVTNTRQPLFDPLAPNNRWRLRGTVTFDGFPPNTYVPARGIILVVSFNPKTQAAQLAEFRARYNIPASVAVFGPYAGALNNGSGRVELVKPDPPQRRPHPDAGFVPYILADKVTYKDTAPWPAGADGTGLSLQRKNPYRYGNDPLNWRVAAPTAGLPNAQAPVITVQPQNRSLIPGNDVNFSVAVTGTPPLAYQWRRNGTAISGATQASLTLPGAQLSDGGTYSVVVSNEEDQTVSSNAVLRVDSVKPSVAIANPKSGSRVSNEFLIVRGTAKDDLQVGRVLVKANSGGFAETTGTTDWSLPVQLVPGTNLITAKAVDTGLNESITATIKTVFVVTSPLTVNVVGNGRVTPTLDGQLLEIGRGYTLSAVPGLGSLFQGWVGIDSISNQSVVLITEDPVPEIIHTSLYPFPKASFVMKTNLVLQARFIPNPFLPRKGTYNGLFFEATNRRHESSGFFTLALTESGAYTASWQRGNKKYPLNGRFNLAGLATNYVVVNPSNTVSFELDLGLAGAGALAGRVLGLGWSSRLDADRAVFNPTTNPCSFAGSYTMVIPGTNDVASGPGGTGFGTARIDAGGVISFTGILGEGSQAVQKVAIAADGRWPYYIATDSGNGSIQGWVTVTNGPDDVHGRLSWFKPALANARFYQNGFTFTPALTGSRYQAPPNRPVLNFTDGRVIFSGGNLVADFWNEVVFRADGKITNLASNKLTLTITQATGPFNGAVTVPGSTRTFSFKGVLDQKRNFGAGHFLDTNQSGGILIVP